MPTPPPIARTLRQAREAKSLSQRNLAARAGLTQAQVSKVENGGDLTVSSLVELARALELELKLVPLKLMPAVESLTRAGAPQPPPAETRQRLAQLKHAIDAFSQRAPGEHVTDELLRLTDMLEQVVLPPGIDNAFARLTRQVTHARLTLQHQPSRNALSKMRDHVELRGTAQFIRDMVAMAQHTETFARPAYTLDDANE
jgi:transcriptional regulator with XRE-family HTH domain